MIRLTSSSTPAQYAPPCLPVARLRVDPVLGERPVGQRGELGRVARERIAHRVGRTGPRHHGRRADRRHQVPPRQPAAVAEQLRLGAQVPAEVRERGDDRVGHRVERGAVDVVGAQRGLEVGVESAPAVEHAQLALGAVERRGQRNRDRRPRVELAFVRRPAADRIGMGREPARERHRDPLRSRAVAPRDVDHQLRRDVAVQALPRQRTRRCQLTRERFLLLAHLELGPFGGLAQRERMLGRERAAGDELLDARATPATRRGASRAARGARRGSAARRDARPRGRRGCRW